MVLRSTSCLWMNSRSVNLLLLQNQTSKLRYYYYKCTVIEATLKFIAEKLQALCIGPESDLPYGTLRKCQRRRALEASPGSWRGRYRGYIVPGPIGDPELRGPDTDKPTHIIQSFSFTRSIKSKTLNRSRTFFREHLRFFCTLRQNCC